MPAPRTRRCSCTAGAQENSTAPLLLTKSPDAGSEVTTFNLVSAVYSNVSAHSLEFYFGTD